MLRGQGGLSAIFWTLNHYGTHCRQFIFKDAVCYSWSIVNHLKKFYCGKGNYNLLNFKTKQQSIMAPGRFSLWHLAGFRYGTWPIFTMALGHFTLWHLAISRYGTWPIFAMALGRFSLWHLAILRYGTWPGYRQKVAAARESMRRRNLSEPADPEGRQGLVK